MKKESASKILDGMDEKPNATIKDESGAGRASYFLRDD